MEFNADLEAELLALMREGRKIAAIKRVREEMNIGLSEAKDAVEQFAAAHGMDKHGGEKSGSVTAQVAQSSLPLTPAGGAMNATVQDEIIALLDQQ